MPYNLQTVEKSNHIRKQNNVQSERKYSGRFEGAGKISENIHRREKRSSYSIGLDLDDSQDSQNDGNQNEVTLEKRKLRRRKKKSLFRI